MQSLRLIFFYKKTAKYPFNVLSGTLEEKSPYIDQLEFSFPTSIKELVDESRKAVKDGIKVIVLWSFYSPEFFETKDELETVKKNCKTSQVIHVAGGVHATAETQMTLEAGWDLVAVGEGEYTLIDLVDCILNEKDPKEIKGIASITDGELRKNGSGNQIDLNDFPAFSEKSGKFGPMEITRGCIYACKFCQTPYMFKARFRHRSIDNIRKGIRILKSRGLRHMRFINPTALSYGSQDESVNLVQIEELLSMVRQELGPDFGFIYYGSYPSECRPEHISQEALRILKKYVTNDNIIIGGQSGSLRMLEHSKRGHNVEVITEAVRLCVEYGFKPNVDFIFGLPGEKEEDRILSLEFARDLARLGARIHGHTFMPLPGTPFKKSKPGKVSKDYRLAFAQLTASGKLYGQWENQIGIAEKLSQL